MPALKDQLDKSFWGDRLEVDADLVLRQIRDDAYLEGWVARLAMRPRALLADRLGIGGELSPRETRRAILDARERLAPFMLVSDVAGGKRVFAILEVARAKLPAEAIEGCRISEERFDRLGLMWLLYLDDPENLELVFHLDRTQRKGFARMVLSSAAQPKPGGPDAASFFTRGSLQAILDDHEREQRSMRQSHCAAILDDGGRYQVFIKRDHKTAFVAHGSKNTFGFEPEWMVLRFDPDLRRVQISAVSPDVPLRIANLVASRFFGAPVTYENETITTPVGKIRALLATLLAEPAVLPIVEVTVKNCGLHGGPQLRLSDQENRALSTAIEQLGGMIGSPLAHVEDIESLKVCFAKKRIKVIFEAEGEDAESFIVRYADQPLNGAQRRAFERMMADTYGVTVLSTEKCYAD
jgi:hypothetical protein